MPQFSTPSREFVTPEPEPCTLAKGLHAPMVLGALVATVTKFSDPPICRICGKQMTEDENPDGTWNPDLNCGGDCWQCIQEAEKTQDVPEPLTAPETATSPQAEAEAQEAEPVAEVETPGVSVATEAPARSSLLEQLKELAEMKREGLLTEEEFTEYKAAILAEAKGA